MYFIGLHGFWIVTAELQTRKTLMITWSKAYLTKRRHNGLSEPRIFLWRTRLHLHFNAGRATETLEL